MRKKITYQDEPLTFGRIMDNDFLPSPEEFRRARLKQEHIAVTLSLPKNVVDVLKQEAKKRQASYQTLLQTLIADYTRQKSHISS